MSDYWCAVVDAYEPPNLGRRYSVPMRRRKALSQFVDSRGLALVYTIHKSSWAPASSLVAIIQAGALAAGATFESYAFDTANGIEYSREKPKRWPIGCPSRIVKELTPKVDPRDLLDDDWFTFIPRLRSGLFRLREQALIDFVGASLGY